ncbi:uncharacterized protein K452DRAFT_308785 [Aplosporella prunicola CBS 121167]|uniref:Rhodopsin domain-containing protein n=1 Tax=Aplosporella prunicola CBS 121167 TaxID=1176127 RepID=A0A6A6BEH8_9PEZI|nr:uncharacterized protein K452DRAFT_308785 [Aplosporella prunicola CBS 121167]KAF2141715.1 hypothetical protein K452DRAFT_308785 [Aplosporella prunicola CBS 121167]
MAPLADYDVFGDSTVRGQIVANIILVILATVMVVLRYVARRIRNNPIWWDDGWVVASMIMQITYAQHGMGHHIATIPPQNQVFVAKQLIAYQIVYYASMVTVKQSYLFFYLRIFIDRKFRLAAWVCMGIVFGYWAGSMMQVFLLCTPFEMNWNPAAGGHCASYNVSFTTIGIVNMFTDLIIMFLPIPFIRGLQMAIGAKVGLYIIFLIGLFVTAISIIRIRVLSLIDFNDLSYSMPAGVFWTIVEPSVAIINACIPTLRPLLKAISPSRLWGSGNGTSEHKGTSGYLRTIGQGGPSSSKYQGVHDEYPLTRIEEGVTTINITTSKGGSLGDDDSYRADSEERHDHPADGLGGIAVTQEWNVSNHRIASAGNLLS